MTDPWREPQTESRRLIGVKPSLAVVAAVAACLFAGGCGSVRAPAPSGPARSQPASSTARQHGATLAENRERATRQAAWLMTLVPVPSRAIRLAAAPAPLPGPALGMPAAISLIDRVRSWRLPMPLDQAVTWITAHHPHGLSGDGSSSGWSPSEGATTGYSYAGPPSPAWQSSDLEIEVAAAGQGTSVMRADAVVVWLDPVPVRDSATGPRLRVTVAGGCPKTDACVVGVRNQGRDLASRLLPVAKPNAGLECRYYGLNGRPWQLHSRSALGVSAARHLAAAMARLPLSHTIGGVFSCPMDDGSAEIIALSYPGRPDVDLWVKLNGCARVTNGFIAAAG